MKNFHINHAPDVQIDPFVISVNITHNTDEYKCIVYKQSSKYERFLQGRNFLHKREISTGLRKGTVYSHINLRPVPKFEMQCQ